MGTLLAIVDFIVLLLLFVVTLRTAWKEQIQGSGSLVLSICLALAFAVFAIVSFSAYLGLVEASSSVMQGIFLLVLLVMAALLRLSWFQKPAA